MERTVHRASRMRPNPTSRLLIALNFVGAMALAQGCGGAAPSDSHPDLRTPAAGAACAPASAAPPEAVALRIGAQDEAEARYWRPVAGRARQGAGIVFVSGVDGGFIEPADEMYARTAALFAAQGVPSVFVKYRRPGELEPSVRDALAAAAYLKERGATRLAIAGWSFGGAVIAHSAAREPAIATAIGFAPQSLDTEPVASFTASQSLLLFHSDTDENVPFDSSEIILSEAPAGIRKGLVPISGADHLLTGEGDRIAPVFGRWLEEELRLDRRCFR